MTTTETTPSAAFPEARGREKGYEKRAVDAFLARARDAFEVGGEPLTAAEVRQVVVPARAARLRHRLGGCRARPHRGRVRRARARRGRCRQSGARAWVGQTRETAQAVLDRLARPKRQRFDRVSALRYGYRIDEVDLVADKIARYLETGDSVTVEQVRAVAFRMQRGGYREAQVDAVLDAVVDVMLAVA